MNKTIKNRFIAVVTAAITMGVASGSAFAGGALGIDFKRDNFGPSMTTINNLYWPLTPISGSQTFTYIGENDDECVINTIVIDSTVIKEDFTNAHLIPVLDGLEDMEAQVVVDKEWLVRLDEGEECNALTDKSNDELTEVTVDWYSQDVFGNIWYMGEESESFEDECGPYPGTGNPECLEGSWEAGKLGVLPPPEVSDIVGEPGIVVPSDWPMGGDPLTPGTYYMQESAEGAEDMAKILKLSTSLSVEDGIEPREYTESECRKVKEWNPYEPGESVEHKWYCKGGNGLVLIEGIGGGPTEVETLVDIVRLP